jgi:hypothetical protein
MDTSPQWSKQLSTELASDYLEKVHGVRETPGTFAKKRVTGGGPPFSKWGRFPVYSPQDLDAYVEGRLSEKVTTTAALPGPRLFRPGRPKAKQATSPAPKPPPKKATGGPQARTYTPHERLPAAE